MAYLWPFSPVGTGHPLRSVVTSILVDGITLDFSLLHLVMFDAHRARFTPICPCIRLRGAFVGRRGPNTTHSRRV